MSALTPVAIIPRKSNYRTDNLIQMSSQLNNQLLIENSQEVQLVIGKKPIEVNIQIKEMESNEILFPENLYSEFYLPVKQIKFHARYSNDIHTLHLGPVIALLTDIKTSGKEVPHFRSIHSFCEELHHGISENGGFFYVFTYRNFTAQGYFFDNGKWHSFVPPLPDVIYNRIHSRRLEYADDFAIFRKKLIELNIPYFNDRYLSKWEVHDRLINENHLQPHIPETKIFSKENLVDFIKRHETVFIKPIHGSQGRNIFKLIKEKDLYSIKSSITSKPEEFSNPFRLEDIYQHIQPLLNNRIYILQQGISLTAYESRGMDFRVLCHKTVNNNWHVTSVVARISAEDEFVSNIARGGEILAPLIALGSLMSKKDAKETLTRMKDLSIETAAALSFQSPGIIGELGIDIGIDQEGNPWLIEVNSKPSKNFDDGLLKIRPSAKAIIQFCTMLAFDTSLCN
ncbi:YheC/YheD family protein [Neobacillus sp. FSL H8-0543]|uniref:YheC/YheD family endospore coat-associated protein n=1 Tax=Neobacillus sp. FSL H8-0543 TaxID=2954672 RepID=UPI0031593F4C